MSEVRSILQSALKDLDAKVERIEQVLEHKLQKAEQEQQDLFAGHTANISHEQTLQNQDAANANGDNDIDPAAVTRRLDTAIARVEQLLKEG